MKTFASRHLKYVTSGILVVICLIGATNNLGSWQMFPFIVVGLISAVGLTYYKNNSPSDSLEKDTRDIESILGSTKRK